MSEHDRSQEAPVRHYPSLAKPGDRFAISNGHTITCVNTKALSDVPLQPGNPVLDLGEPGGDQFVGVTIAIAKYGEIELTNDGNILSMDVFPLVGAYTGNPRHITQNVLARFQTYNGPFYLQLEKTIQSDVQPFWTIKRVQPGPLLESEKAEYLNLQKEFDGFKPEMTDHIDIHLRYALLEAYAERERKFPPKTAPLKAHFTIVEEPDEDTKGVDFVFGVGSYNFDVLERVYPGLNPDEIALYIKLRAIVDKPQLKQGFISLEYLDALDDIDALQKKMKAHR